MTFTDSSRLVAIESLLETFQDTTVLLDKLIADVRDEALIERFRSVLTGTLSHWDAVGAEFERLNQPAGERRKGQRMRAIGEMTITAMASKDRTAGRCIDVSRDGLCAVTSQAFELGETFALDFRLFGAAAPISAQGEVRWCRPRVESGTYQAGFQFKD